jgi:hypothetical protein
VATEAAWLNGNNWEKEEINEAEREKREKMKKSLDTHRPSHGRAWPTCQANAATVSASIQGIILVVLRACHGDRDVQTFLRELVHPYVVVH